MDDLISLSASAAAAAIRAKATTSLALVDAYLARIAERDAVVHAWAYLQPERLRAAASACDATAPTGPLHGVPIGVKDIIDTADMPTEYGSAVHKGNRPSRDAACVSMIRRAGGIIMGKTVSTEFAMYHPSKTRNPHKPSHTPGGSSSGSAAAVADRQAPLALGTQTSGSIIRPASFCGVIGYKPTMDTFPIEGTKVLASSLDTLGCLARSLDDVSLLYEVFCGIPPRLTTPPPTLRSLRLACWIPPYAKSRPDADGLQRGLERLAAQGIDIAPLHVPDAFATLNQAHATIMGYELARNHVYQYAPEQRPSLGVGTAACIGDGWTVTFEDYLRSRQERRLGQAAFDALAESYDAILVPASVGEAPSGHESVGDPAFNRLWSLLGTPALTLPIGRGPSGLPIGLQLVAKRDGDFRLIEAARVIEAAIAA